tara:strand:+ start:295 stop:396 length:102 start_codon:yes stop_codon:yes gene_type:complete
MSVPVRVNLRGVVGVVGVVGVDGAGAGEGSAPI